MKKWLDLFRNEFDCLVNAAVNTLKNRPSELEIDLSCEVQ